MALPERAPGPGIVHPLAEDVTVSRLKDDVNVSNVDTLAAVRDYVEAVSGNVNVPWDITGINIVDWPDI
jgi:hypothetical protein